MLFPFSCVYADLFTPRVLFSTYIYEIFESRTPLIGGCIDDAIVLFNVAEMFNCRTKVVFTNMIRLRIDYDSNAVRALFDCNSINGPLHGQHFYYG